MSSRNTYDDDDECDSSFVYRQRQAIKIENKNELKKVNEDELVEEEDNDEPLNLSLKSRNEDEVKYNSRETSVVVTKPVFNENIDKDEKKEMNKENMIVDDDLTDLGWLTNYNIVDDLKIQNFGNLSPEYRAVDDDEADSAGHRPITPFMSATLLQNMLVTQTKPPYSYSCLIFMSIESSPRKRLTVKDIYSWILNGFPYFRSIPSGSWKNSIRHNLSHNKCFKKVDKNLLTCRDFSGKGSLWCVNPEYRMVLIETLKKMPQKAYSILQDVPEAMGVQVYRTTSLKSPRSMPRITSVSTKQLIRKQNETRVNLLSSSIDDVKLTDFYKKACKESSNDCSDFDAANALLMIKSSSNEAQTSRSAASNADEKRSIKVRALSQQEFLSDKNSKKRNSDENKKNIIHKKVKSCNLALCAVRNEDHTYSNALKQQEEEEEQKLVKEAPKVESTPNKRKCRKKSEPVKVENVDEINNFSDSYSFNSGSDCLDFCDTNTTCSNASDSDRISTVSADTLRNALLELSRAAELVEDKEDDIDDNVDENK